MSSLETPNNKEGKSRRDVLKIAAGAVASFITGSMEAAERSRPRYSEGVPSVEDVRKKFHARCGLNKKCLENAEQIKRGWDIVRAHAVTLDTSPDPEKEMIDHGKRKLIDVLKENKQMMKENEAEFERYFRRFERET